MLLGYLDKKHQEQLNAGLKPEEEEIVARGYPF
jgi:hypothetical protein